MQLPPLPLVVLDTETTGFVPRVHRVIEFASIEVRDGKVKTEYEQLFHHADVPPVVQVLTRIRTTDLAGKPALADHHADILQHLPEDYLLVGQNIPFDISMLKGEGIDLSERPWIDTSMLASLVFPELDSYSLGYLSATLKLNHDPPHRALGDVRATLELLGKCWERLLELPEDLQDLAGAIMERAPKGYRMLFAALPPPAAKKEPKWLKSWSETAARKNHSTIQPLALHHPASSPALMDESLDPQNLHAMIAGALEQSDARQWIAVKNLRPILQRLPDDLAKKIRVLHPPHALIDIDAVLRFSKQTAYTADEATLALKLAWYEPTRRDELPMHGGEEAVWNGKLSCTATSKAYLEQFQDLPNVVLLDHRELLEFLQNPEHPGAKAMTTGAGTCGEPSRTILPSSAQGNLSHIVIDDASMLEDTATKAFGWFAAIDDVRAAAQGNTLLTKFVDTLQLWIEKIRQFQDIRYLTHGDLTSQDSKGLRSLVEDVLKEQWPQQLLQHLEDLRLILDPENLAHRIAWIEQKPNGSQMLQSVPERIGQLLGEHLFKKFPTTLLIPQGSAGMLPEILPVASGKWPVAATSHKPQATSSVPISFEPHPNLEEILTNPPDGKTVILLPGKGAIEDLYVKYTEALEKRGATIICQGMSGGMGRMRAEFLAADAPALWLLTPWMFEGVDLPAGSADRLILKTLPFDHPSHPVLSRRAQHYRDPFNEYSLPRLLHRIFRLLRTFARFRTESGDMRLLDDRIQTKAYGAVVKRYLEQFSSAEAKDADDAPSTRLGTSSDAKDQTATFARKPVAATIPPATAVSEPKPESKPKKAAKPKKKDQMTLF